MRCAYGLETGAPVDRLRAWVVVGVGVQPESFRCMRPDGTKRPVKQERSKPAALKGGNEPEMGQFDDRLANAGDLAQAGGVAVDAQDMDVRRRAGEKALEVLRRHAQPLVPLHGIANGTVEADDSRRYQAFRAQPPRPVPGRENRGRTAARSSPDR